MRRSPLAKQVPTRGAELRGSGPHDGMTLDMQTFGDVVALAVVTRGPDGTLTASLSVRDGCGVAAAEVAPLLAEMAVSASPAGGGFPAR